MADGDERFVTWGRWDAEHHALRAHIDEQLAGLGGRVAALEAAAAERRGRQWALTLAVLTALVLPLLAVAIAAVLTARGH